MPTARESLLDAARSAVERLPWPIVRMVEVAAAAGVSRQTLYNEFGDKAGLGTALMNRQVSDFLDDLERTLHRSASTASPDETLAETADWVLGAARDDALVRATLTGCRREALPRHGHEPGQLVAEVRDRAVRALRTRPAGGDGAPDETELADRCETAIRLAISQLVAPSWPATRGAQSPLRRSRVASSRRRE
jgi:AcrR family transcriptional regulator